MSSQFSVTDQAGRWRCRGGEGTVVSLPHSSWKKKPICVLLLTSVSQWKNLWGLPPLSISPSFRLSIPPFIADCPVAMHFCWYCYKAFSLTGIPYREAGWQHHQVELHTDGLYHCLFSSKHKRWVVFPLDPGSWLDLSFFLRWTPGTDWTPTQSAQMHVDQLNLGKQSTVSKITIHIRNGSRW